MTTTSTIYVSEQIDTSDRRGTRSTPGALVIVCPTAPTRTLFVRDALSHLGTLHRNEDRFDAAVLACDARSDWSAIHTRALIARALLALIAPGGRFLLQAPHGFAHRPMLLALLEALAQLTPRGDVSFGIEFGASVISDGTSVRDARGQSPTAQDVN